MLGGIPTQGGVLREELIGQLLRESQHDLEDIRVHGAISRILAARDRIILRMTGGRGYGDVPSLIRCKTDQERLSVQAILQALDLLVSALASDMGDGADPREIMVQ